jgi:hypothetical protein
MMGNRFSLALVSYVLKKRKKRKKERDRKSGVVLGRNYLFWRG